MHRRQAGETKYLVRRAEARPRQGQDGGKKGWLFCLSVHDEVDHVELVQQEHHADAHQEKPDPEVLALLLAPLALPLPVCRIVHGRSRELVNDGSGR
jgi:hypothetical protein